MTIFKSKDQSIDDIVFLAAKYSEENNNILVHVYDEHTGRPFADVHTDVDAVVDTLYVKFFD